MPGPPSLNGMCRSCSPGALGQDLGVDVLIGADAGAAVAHLARMLLGVVDELGEGLGRLVGKFVVVARKNTGASASGAMICTSRS